MKTANKSLRRLALTLACASATIASAQSTDTFGFKLPPNYLGRFGSTAVLLSTEDGYGVRYFPLPFKEDIRFTVAKRPKYWEYNLTARIKDTSFGLGIFDNGNTSAAGIPKFEITRNPRTGLQFSGVVQGGTSHSHFTGGYAFTLDKNRVQVLNNAGVALQGGVIAPYTFSQVAAGYPLTTGNYATRFSVTGQLYTFPLQKKAQASVDLTLVATLKPAKGLQIDASHLERFVLGTVAISDFNLDRYQQSTLNTTYRFSVANPAPAFTVGAVRNRITRNWTGDYTYVYGDLFFRFNALNTMIGPSVGYQWGPTNATTKWLFGLVALPR